jgi:hypothetical protein
MNERLTQHSKNADGPSDLEQVDVGCGSKADLTAPKSNFRFTPETGLVVPAFPRLAFDAVKSSLSRHRLGPRPPWHQRSLREAGATLGLRLPRGSGRVALAPIIRRI